jgi:hypothetical protein
MSAEDKAEVLNGECPTCRGTRNSWVRGRHHTSWKDPEHPIDGYDTYYILECGGCATSFFRRDSYFSEDDAYGYHPQTGETVVIPTIRTTYWPPLERRSRPDWLQIVEHRDPVLNSLFGQLYTALDSGLTVLAAIGVRTAFDRATVGLGIDPMKRFDQKLQALFEGGWIGETEKDILAALIDAGSAAAHRGWSPETHQLDTMMSVMEGFLDRHFVQRERASALRDSTPKRGS